MDRDAQFSAEVLDSIKELGVEPSRIAPRCAWQNPYAERWVGTARRKLFDRVVVFGREHALALLLPFLNYYPDDRTHLGLNLVQFFAVNSPARCQLHGSHRREFVPDGVFRNDR